MRRWRHEWVRAKLGLVRFAQLFETGIIIAGRPGRVVMFSEDWDWVREYSGLPDGFPEPYLSARDFEPNEPVWLVGGGILRVPAVAVEPPGDQSSHTFEVAPGHESEWPWPPHCDCGRWGSSECDCGELDNSAYYAIAWSRGHDPHDMRSMGPYPLVYGQTAWKWKAFGNSFRVEPREVKK